MISRESICWWSLWSWIYLIIFFFLFCYHGVFSNRVLRLKMKRSSGWVQRRIHFWSLSFDGSVLTVLLSSLRCTENVCLGLTIDSIWTNSYLLLGSLLCCSVTSRCCCSCSWRLTVVWTQEGMNVKLDIWFVVAGSIFEYPWIKHVCNLWNLTWRMHDRNLIYNPKWPLLLLILLLTFTCLLNNICQCLINRLDLTDLIPVSSLV